MTDAIESDERNTPPKASPPFQFGPEVEIEEAGFSFQPIIGFELEIDGSAYLYSDDGNLEISLVGGALTEETSIAELNDELAGEFMENFDSFKLIEAGTDTIQDITGFLNQIQFVNAEEEGQGCALICSPCLNQYFFILVISSTEHWQKQGQAVYEALKSRIRFYPQFAPDEVNEAVDEHPDLTLETYPGLAAEEDFLLQIEKNDTSLLLAARSPDPQDRVSLTALIAPDDESLYHYDPQTGALESALRDQPIQSDHGEVCCFFPRDNQHTLHAGTYQFAFNSRSGLPLEEIQVIIRSGRALDLQALDLNLWIAADDEAFSTEDRMGSFVADLRQALIRRLSPLNLIPGEIEIFHAAPDEMETFSRINIETDLADCSYMIAETVSNGRALNVGVVQQLFKEDGTALTAVSTGSPGMILAPASPHAGILAAWPACHGDIQLLADALIEQLVIFTGINVENAQQIEGQPLTLNREIAWRLRRHPLFYDVD